MGGIKRQTFSKIFERRKFKVEKYFIQHKNIPKYGYSRFKESRKLNKLCNWICNFKYAEFTEDPYRFIEKKQTRLRKSQKRTCKASFQIEWKSITFGN